MNFKGNNKVQTSMETVLVATSATTPTGNLVNNTTAFNIGNGQLACMSFDLDGTPAMGTFLTAGTAPTSTNDAVKLIQGTPRSNAIHTADVWEVNDPATVESDVIGFDRILDYVKTNASFGQLSAQVVTDLGGVTAGKTYDGFIFLNSVRGDRDWSDNDEPIYEQVDTALDLSQYTDATDFVFQSLIYKFNTRSKLASTSNSAAIRRGNKDYVVLGINTTPGSGTVINTLAEGGSVNIMSDNGVVTALPITNEIVTTFARLIDNGDLAGTETIEVVDVATAGAAAKVNGLIVLGLDHDLSAYFDDIAQVRTNVTLNMGEQFIAEGFTQAGVNPAEAVGNARRELIASRDRHQLTVHTKQNHPHGEFFSEGYQYIVDGTWYNRAVVTHYDYEETITVRPRYVKRATVLWSAVPASGTTVANAAIALGASNPPISFTSTEPSAIAIFEAWKDR